MPPQPPLAPKALRFVLEYRDGNFLERGRSTVRKLVRTSPPTFSWGEDSPRSGFWIELRDEMNRAIHRQVLHDPFRVSAEIHHADSQTPLRQTPVARPGGIVHLLLPDVPEAVTLVVVSSPLTVRGMFEPAREVVRFDLRRGKQED